MSSAAGAQTITQPSGRVDVPAAREYATERYQDPINMAEYTDLGWFTYSKDGPLSNLSNIQLSGGRFSATATNSDPSITILDTANPVAVPRAHTGNLSPLDASLYRTIAFRMRLSGSQGVRASDGQLLWTSKSLYESAVATSGSFATYGGWQIYQLDVPSLGLAVGSPWQGLVRWLRLDPTVVAGSTIEIDWIRVASTADASTFRTISWTGGAVDIFLDDNSSEADGTLGLIAKNNTTLSRSVSGGSFQFQPGALPAGNYYVGIRAAGTSNPLRYSSGYFHVTGLPTLRFTSPSAEGSADDFATARLGDAWNLTSMSDVDAVTNATGVGIVSVNAQTTAGASLGTVSALKGTSLGAGATGDPYVHLLLDSKRGASAPIDANRYRILSFDLALPGARDMARGSIARVVWKRRGEVQYNVSEDIVVSHRAGATVFDRITLDLKTLPLEPGGGSPSYSGWAGLVDAFRLDPHEFTPATDFYFRNVRLTSLEQAGTSYRIAWNYADAESGARLSLHYDDDDANFDGGAIVQGLNPADGGYTWHTAGLTPGREYHIYARLTRADGTLLNQTYAPLPIVGGGSGSAGAPSPGPSPNGTPNPLLAVDAPGNGAYLAQPAFLGGWAIDLGAASGTGVDAIHVWAYPATGAPPIFAGAAGLGGARPDVGGIFGGRFTNSGYGMQVQGLPAGAYMLVVYAHSTVTGTFNAVQIVNVTLTGPQPNPRMAIDIPAGGQAVGSSFTVAGWAVDLGAPSGTGVDTVHIWAWPTTGAPPIFLGVASYGGSRPDVGAVFGARATKSSYGLIAKGLKPGTYDVVVSAHSSLTGTFNNAQVVRVTVR